MPEDVLHIRGQSFSHSPVLIEGNEEALKKLKSAIEEALSGKKLGFQQSFASDGDGYDLLVLKREDMQNSALPYHTLSFGDEGSELISGWDIVERSEGMWRIKDDTQLDI